MWEMITVDSKDSFSNECMMHLYSALCIVVHPKRFKIMWGGGGGVSPQLSPVCSIHLDDATAATGQWRQCDHHTPATGGEERDNQVYTLTTHQLQVERRERQRANQVYALTTHQPQVERRERQRANQVYALTTHQLQVESHRANQVYALTTHQLQVKRRERHRANQVYALTTHQLQVERRERQRANQVYALTTHQPQVERRES